MRSVVLPIPQLAFVVATRAMLGAGIGLLVAGLLEGVLHVVPLVHALDVDELVEEQVAVGHGCILAAQVRKRHAVCAARRRT